MFPAAKRIREYAGQYAVTLKELCRRSHIGDSTIRNSEKSEHQLSLSLTEEFCEANGIPLWAFFFPDFVDPQRAARLTPLISALLAADDLPALPHEAEKEEKPGQVYT